MEPKRIQLSRKNGWRKPANTVVVARPGEWGNPFQVGKDSVFGYVPDLATAVEFHRQWLSGTKEGGAVTQKANDELRGKNLACWCRPGGPCHGDTLLEVANTRV